MFPSCCVSRQLKIGATLHFAWQQHLSKQETSNFSFVINLGRGGAGRAVYLNVTQHFYFVCSQCLIIVEHFLIWCPILLSIRYFV